jgi:hypothetical protein
MKRHILGGNIPRIRQQMVFQEPPLTVDGLKCWRIIACVEILETRIAGPAVIGGEGAGSVGSSQPLHLRGLAETNEMVPVLARADDLNPEAGQKNEPTDSQGDSSLTVEVVVEEKASGDKKCRNQKK